MSQYFRAGMHNIRPAGQMWYAKAFALYAGFWQQQAVLRKTITLPPPKKASKKATQKAARKAAKKFIPEPDLLLSWNRSKTGLVYDGVTLWVWY